MKKILKRIICSSLIIYGVDMLTYKVGVIIPINFFSVGVTTILGIPGLIAYILIYFKYLF